MLILFGEREIAGEKESGTFDCPICQSKQSYLHQQIQVYFSIFFIKTFKLSPKTDTLICTNCHSCFNPLITQTPDLFQTAVDKAVLLRALSYLIVGYGDTQHSRQRLIDIYFEHTHITLQDSEITNEVLTISSGGSPTLPLLKNNKLYLSHQAKQIILLASYQLASQSCLMEFDDRVIINTLAANLDIEIAEVNYLITSISQN